MFLEFPPDVKSRTLFEESKNKQSYTDTFDQAMESFRKERGKAYHLALYSVNDKSKLKGYLKNYVSLFCT